MKPGGIFLCSEPFAADAQPEVMERLRTHTQSRHGGFTSQQMLGFAEGLELIELVNCYWAASAALVEELWRHMSKTGDWSLLDRAFAVAQLDLRSGLTTSRREATALKLIARKPA